MLDDGRVVQAERKALEVTEGAALLENPIVGDGAAADAGARVLENGDGGRVMHLAEVEPDEVFDGGGGRGWVDGD